MRWVRFEFHIFRILTTVLFLLNYNSFKTKTVYYVSQEVILLRSGHHSFIFETATHNIVIIRTVNHYENVRFC